MTDRHVAAGAAGAATAAAGERPPLVYLIGAPRSGTTWLQRLLGGHPEIATGQETDLVNVYVRDWMEVWERQLPGDPAKWRAMRHRGLPAVLTRADFEENLRRFLYDVYAHVLAMKPGATTVLDKNPGYATEVELLAALAPDAKVIHIVRDGRDVASSLMNAGNSWAKVWAPRRVSDAALIWRRHVESARGVAGSLPYHEVHYEDLLDEGVQPLVDCLEFCGVESDKELAQSLLHSQSIEGLRDSGGRGALGSDSLLWGGEVVERLGSAPEEPKGFFGEGRSGSWRDWSPHDAWAFREVAGQTLRDFGYEPPDRWGRVTDRQEALFSLRRRGYAAARTVRRSTRRAFRAATTPPAS